MLKINNPNTFFAYLRKAPFGGRLTQGQIDGVNALFNEAAQQGLSAQEAAYVLATTFHETGGKMAPIRENMSYRADRILEVFGSNHSARVTRSEAASLANNPQGLAERVYGLGNPRKAKELGNVRKGDGWKYRGGGLDQRTGRGNYARVGLEGEPDKVLQLPEAARVMITDMIKGSFTSKKLGDYFDGDKANPEGARAVINGTDKAKLIAGYYKNFLDSINAANEFSEPEEVSHDLATADDVKASASGSVKSLIGGTVGTAVASAIVGVNNPWAFGVSALLLILGAGAFYMFASGRWSVNRLKDI